MKKIYLLPLLMFALVACVPNDEPENLESDLLPDWYYAGGKDGTTTVTSSVAFEQPTPSVEFGSWLEAFMNGEALFEKKFNSDATGTRSGLGPVYVRSSCLHCHPGYGHGKSVEEGTYNTDYVGNGTLLVVYDKSDEAYVPWVAGMPQLHAVAPFKAPIDESQVTVTWKTVATCAASNNQMQFPDGEPFELRYPEVNLPTSAIYGYDELVAAGAKGITNYGVKLENTIGIYGTGLTDAIPDDSITAQWAKEEQAYHKGYLKNWKSEWFSGGTWMPNAKYKSTAINSDGREYVRRYTYAMSRGPLQDAAGANAIWNITNVTRSDRRAHYLDLSGKFYAQISSKDPDVQAGWNNYIDRLIAVNADYARFKTGNAEADIYAYLTDKNLPAEMTDKEYKDFMVWHRGLAVPAVRNVHDENVLRGRQLFMEIGCAECHRPSWTTGNDEIQDPAGFFTDAYNSLPRYRYQTIWPYSDFVQHKLYMESDIRTGWCRTTPLWGRGLHKKVTGDPYEARMHDTRARNVVEAIMWHGYSEQSDALESVKKFYNLLKKDRDAIVAFVNAI